VLEQVIEEVQEIKDYQERWGLRPPVEIDSPAEPPHRDDLTGEGWGNRADATGSGDPRPNPIRAWWDRPST